MSPVIRSAASYDSAIFLPANCRSRRHCCYATQVTSSHTYRTYIFGAADRLVRVRKERHVRAPPRVTSSRHFILQFSGQSISFRICRQISPWFASSTLSTSRVFATFNFDIWNNVIGTCVFYRKLCARNCWFLFYIFAQVFWACKIEYVNLNSHFLISEIYTSNTFNIALIVSF